MKTIALILLSSCLSLWGQTSATDTNLDVDTALRDEILRRAVRQFGTNDGPPAPAAAATNALTNMPAPVVAITPPAAPGNPPMTVIPPPTTRLTPPDRSRRSNRCRFKSDRRRVIPAVVNPPARIAPPAATAAVPPAVGGPPAFGPARAPGARPRFPGAAPAPAAAEPVQAAEMTDQTLDFPSVDLNTFLSVYAGIVQRTVLHGPLPAVTISLRTQKPLTRTELIQAMDSVLAMNNITMVNQGSNFVEAVPAPESAMAGAKFSTTKAEDIPESFQYMNQIVQLKYIKPSEVQPLLVPFAKIPGNIYPFDSSPVLVIRDYAANVKRMMELIKQLDVVTPISYEQEIIPIKYAKVADIASALSSLGAGAGASIGTSRSTGAAGSRGGLSGAGGYGAGTTLGGGLGSPGGVSPLGGGAFGARATPPPTLASRLAGIATQANGGRPGDIEIFTGATKIVADERSHSLLVLAGHQDMEMIKSIVKKLDVVLQQVLIEAIIMEVNLDDELNMGVSYLQTSQSTGELSQRHRRREQRHFSEQRQLSQLRHQFRRAAGRLELSGAFRQ